MKLEYLDIEKLLPTQTGIKFESSKDEQNLYNLVRFFDPLCFEPVSVVESESRYLIGDGHHRTALTYLYNKSSGQNLPVPVIVVENTRELKQFFGGSNRHYTIESFKAHNSTAYTFNRSDIPNHIGEMPIWDLDDMLCSELQCDGGDVFTSNKTGNKFLFRLPSRQEFERAIWQSFDNLKMKGAA